MGLVSNASGIRIIQSYSSDVTWPNTNLIRWCSRITMAENHSNLEKA
jgi:hypothetical protein